MNISLYGEKQSLKYFEGELNVKKTPNEWKENFRVKDREERQIQVQEE